MKCVKHVLFSTLLFLSLFSTTANAQIDVTVNPVGLLFGGITAGADFVLAENISVEGTLGFRAGDDGATSLDFRSIPITAVGKYYFSPDDGADKFYAGVFARFISRKYSAADSGTTFAEYSQTRLGLGFNIGYKVVGKSGIVFDIGLGAGRALLDNTSYEDDGGTQVEVDWPDLMFTGKLGIGYRFGG